MQYLLSAEEYSALKAGAQVERDALKADLQKLCTLVACHMPIQRDWESRDRPERPWGCILVKAQHPGYCDKCPVQDLCPHVLKEFSR